MLIQATAATPLKNSHQLLLYASSKAKWARAKALHTVCVHKPGLTARRVAIDRTMSHYVVTLPFPPILNRKIVRSSP